MPRDFAQTAVRLSADGPAPDAQGAEGLLLAAEERSCSASGRPAVAEPLRRDPRMARSSALVSIGLLLTNLLGAAQALVILFVVGKGQATDAFLSVYALYTPFALLGGTMRRSFVPLLGQDGSDDAFRERVTELASRVLTLALVGIGGAALLSPLIAYFVSHSRGAHARDVAITCLLILMVAAYLQIHGGTLAAVLNALSRYHASVVLYVIGSAVAVVCSAILSSSIGVTGAAIGVVVGTAVLVGGHHMYLRRLGIRIRIHPRWMKMPGRGRLAFRLTAGASLSVALQINLAIALSALAHPAGVATLYSYAYYIVGLMLNLSAAPLSLTILPRLVASLSARGRPAVRETLLTVMPFAFFVLVPFVVGFAAFGRPVMGSVFGPVLSAASVDQMYSVAVILELMLVFASVYTFAGSLLLALREWRRAMQVAFVTVGAQAILIYPVAHFGPLAVAGAHSAAAGVSALALLFATFGRETMSTVLAVVRRVSPALALGAIFLIARVPLGAHPSAVVALAAAALALVAYVGAGVMVWPAVARPFVMLLTGAGRP